MSWFSVSLRLIGDIEILEEAATAMEGLPFELLRKGERYHGRRRVQSENVLLLDLAEWERGLILPSDDADAVSSDERTQLACAATIVQQLASSLAALNRKRVTAELLISINQYEEEGGFNIPSALVAAAAAAGLEVGISILAVLLDDKTDETEEPATGKTDDVDSEDGPH